MDIRRRVLLSKTLHEGGSNEETSIINNYLTIEAREDGLTASLSTNACEYCVDGDGNWKSLAAGTVTESINTGQTLSFRGDLTPVANEGIGTFKVNKKFNLNGNVMSMLFGDAGKDNYSLSGKNYAFDALFYGCTNLQSVSANFLPATTLANSCYNGMFMSCTSLTVAPELPATTLANSCYSYMFRNCRRLTTAPELPATTLANNCYTSMFMDCSSLTTAPALPATTLAKSCYSGVFYSCRKLNYIKMLATNISAQDCLMNWVYSVASTGTFVKNPAMTSLPTGTSGIPKGWLVVNDGEESSGGNEITFYINDVVEAIPMKALPNMTWGEFVNSEYANQNSMLTNFRLDDYGSYNGIRLYHEEAMQDMTLYFDTSYYNNVKDYDIIEDGKTYYAY